MTTATRMPPTSEKLDRQLVPGESLTTRTGGERSDLQRDNRDSNPITITRERGISFAENSPLGSIVKNWSNATSCEIGRVKGAIRQLLNLPTDLDQNSYTIRVSPTKGAHTHIQGHLEFDLTSDSRVHKPLVPFEVKQLEGSATAHATLHMKEKDRQTGQQILTKVRGIAELADSLSQYSTPESSLKSHVSNIGFVGFSTSGVPLVVTKSSTTGESPGFYLANPNAEAPSLTPLNNVSKLDKDLYRYEAGGSVYSIALKEHYQGVWHRVEIQPIRPEKDGDKFARG